SWSAWSSSITRHRRWSARSTSSCARRGCRKAWPVSRTDTPAPRVDVAGTVFEVAGLDDAGRAWIAARYGDFLSERAPDLRLAASITRAVPEDDAAAVATIETHGDDVCLAVGGYRIEGN